MLRGTRTTVYKRDPATFDARQLQLSKVSSYTDLGQFNNSNSTAQVYLLRRHPGSEADLIVTADSHHLPDDLDGTLFLGLVQNCSQRAHLHACFCRLLHICTSVLTASLALLACFNLPACFVCVRFVQHSSADSASMRKDLVW